MHANAGEWMVRAARDHMCCCSMYVTRASATDVPFHANPGDSRIYSAWIATSTLSSLKEFPIYTHTNGTQIQTMHETNTHTNWISVEDDDEHIIDQTAFAKPWETIRFLQRSTENNRYLYVCAQAAVFTYTSVQVCSQNVSEGGGGRGINFSYEVYTVSKNL